MTRRLARSVRAFLLVCSPVLLLGLLAQQPVPPAAAIQPYTYTGTVHAVVAETGALVLITGVGHALRLVHIRTDPATRAMSGAAAMRVTDIALGDKVRVECRMTTAGLVADRINKLPAPQVTP